MLKYVHLDQTGVVVYVESTTVIRENVADLFVVGFLRLLYPFVLLSSPGNLGLRSSE